MAGNTVLLRWNVRCGEPTFRDSAPSFPHLFPTASIVEADATRCSLLVFFKWPITGICVEFVGFVGLFG